MKITSHESCINYAKNKRRRSEKKKRFIFGLFGKHTVECCPRKDWWQAKCVDRQAWHTIVNLVVDGTPIGASAPCQWQSAKR